MKILNVLVLAAFHLLVCGAFDEDNLLSFIRDFLLHQTTPANVNAILCWKNSAKVKLLKMLYSNYFRASLLNMEAEALPYQLPEQNQLFLIDLRCSGWDQALKNAERNKFFRHPYRWLVLSNNSTDIEYLSSLEITIDSRFFLAQETFNGYNLTAVYKINANSDFLFNDIAKWRENKSFDYFNELVVSRNRSDLMGVTLNVSIVITNLDSLNHMWGYINTHVDPASKANYIYVHHLLDMLNASRHFIVRTVWGVRNETTGLFTGMIGDMQRGDAELGGIVSFLTHERIPVIEYSSPTTPTIARFIFRAPPLSYVSNIFTLPFEQPVWISFFALTAITALVLYVIVYWEWKNPEYLQPEDPQQVTRLRANFFDALMVQIGGICQQGSDTEPRSSPGRIALIFSFVALMFLYTSFSANIVALLQTSSDSIKTLEDLLRSNIKLGIEDTPYGRYLFAHETEPIRKAIYQEKVAPKGQPPNILATERGIARMRQEFFSFHAELGGAYKVISDTFQEHEKCGLSEIAYLQVAEPWLPIRKNSTYKEIVKVALRQIQESGIRNRELFRFFPKKPICTGQGSTFVSVGLIDCYYGFLIFGVGFGCSVALLVLEVLSEKYLNKKKLLKLK